jgi:hypothetical protein
MERMYTHKVYLRETDYQTTYALRTLLDNQDFVVLEGTDRRVLMISTTEANADILKESGADCVPFSELNFAENL